MKNQILLCLFLITFSLNAQKRKFNNQGEREDYQAEKLFKNEYRQQSFKKFKGRITVVDEHKIQFDNKTLHILTFNPEINEIFTSGIFYPQLIIGYAVNNPNKKKEEIAKLKDTELFQYWESRNDSLKISDVEELKFLNTSPQKKRFRFWIYLSGSANPQVYFIELTNKKIKTETDLKHFIKDSKLTFLKAGWLII